jgi:hypothetical protein
MDGSTLVSKSPRFLWMPSMLTSAHAAKKLMRPNNTYFYAQQEVHIANNMNSYILCPRILYEIEPAKSNNCSFGASGHG